MLSAQAAHKSSDVLNGDDKDPRDVSNNGFNRFDPKYISIGPKAVRGNNNLNVVAAATANKCATLRHVGRYGGSLKTNSGIGGGLATSPNLRSAKIPSIATVSTDYCQQPKDFGTQPTTPQTNSMFTTNNEILSSAQPVSNMLAQNQPNIMQQVQQQQQQQQVQQQQQQMQQTQQQQSQQQQQHIPAPPPAAPLPPPKPRSTNILTEIPGTTGLGSSYAKEQQQLLQLQQALLQKHQQQSPPPPLPPSISSHQQQPSQSTHHPPTTHILPASAVYSIETSGFAQQNREPPKPQQRSLNPASIVNQPLPEIPTQYQQQQSQQSQASQSKISPQPLCAANLNQYRSLQRPQGSTQKLQLPSQQQQQQQQQQMQLQQHQVQQLQQFVAQQQIPPSLPPKNRHKSGRDAGNANHHMQTLPAKSASLRQHQSLSQEREREREARHEARSRRAETLDNVRSNALAYLEQYCVAAPPPKKQHAHEQPQFMQSQQRHVPPTTPNNNYQQQQQTQQSTGLTAKQLQTQQQQLMDAAQQQFYRSLKRGGSQAQNDLYSVTEL